MSEIKAIETNYNGLLFRSRLEARWAVFFYAAGVKYEYEPDAFMIDGMGYVPDFYLPDYDLYVEVKPAREGALVEVAKAFGLIGTGKIKHLLVLSTFPEGVNLLAHYNLVYLHPYSKTIVCERVLLVKNAIRLEFIPRWNYFPVDYFLNDEEGFIVPWVDDHGGRFRDVDLHECFTKAKAYRFD